MAVVTALRQQEAALLAEQDKMVNDLRQKLLAEKETEKKQFESAFEAKYVNYINTSV